MLVSVITPTGGREPFLPLLLACFRAQTWPELELVVLDDGPRPSPLLSAADPRVRYTHVGARMTIGEKRNRLVEQARGEVIVQFDDDDYYAPHYVERMVRGLADRDLAKLSGWFGYSMPKRQAFYWDTTRAGGTHMVLGPDDPLAAMQMEGDLGDFLEGTLWGYGFCYAFRKSAWAAARFDARDHGEDFAFVAALRAAGRSAVHFQDTEGLALHFLHAGNSSRVFPQYLLPPFLLDRFFPQLKLDRYLEAAPPA